MHNINIFPYFFYSFINYLNYVSVLEFLFNTQDELFNVIIIAIVLNSFIIIINTNYNLF